MDSSQHRESIKIPPVSERIINQHPANPSLTSEATGRVYFKPELLGLTDMAAMKNKTAEIAVASETFESIPVYTDGDSLNGSVIEQLLH